MPINASVGTLTFSPRYISQIGKMLEREQFDVLHFHEPFVPFLSLFLLRESTSVNIATFHAYAGFSPSYEFGSRALGGHATRLHGRIAVSAAARHFIDRFFPGDYKVIPNGVDVARYANAVPLARWQDGTPNVLFVGPPRTTQGAARPAQGPPDPAQDRVGAAAPGGRIGPQEREARRYVATRSLQGVEFLGRVSDDEKAQLFRTADVYASPATGGESFGIVLLEAMAAGTPIVCLGHPRLQGRGPARPRGPARAAAGAAGAGRGHRPAAARPRPARRDGCRRPARAPRNSAGRG